MFGLIFRKVFGTKHERDVKRMRPIVVEINAIEPSMQALSDEDLRAKTQEFRQRLADGAEVDELLPEAFAACREARTAHGPDAALRRPAHGRHGAPPRHDRRDGHG